MPHVSKKYKNGEYDGDMEDDKRNGTGTFKYANGGIPPFFMSPNI